MVFDSRLQLCDQWNTVYNRKRKQEHFWIILWRSLELLKGKKCQKTTLSVNSLKYQFELVSLYVTSNELFIYYSYRWIGGIRGIPIHKHKDFENVPSFLNPRQNTAITSDIHVHVHILQYVFKS